MSVPVGDIKRASKGLLKRGLRAVLSSTGAVRSLPPEHWGLSRDETGALTLAGLSLSELGAREGFPLHVVNADRLRRNAERFLATPAGVESGCEAFYSYKTNPVPGVLSELHALGMGAEVISAYEFWLARRLGVPPERIVYNGPAKSEDSIREAVVSDIALLNMNHREETAVVARIAAAEGRKPRVGLRVTVGTGWTAQFGTPVSGGRALRAYEEALASPSLNVTGVHAHRGGMIRSEGELLEFVEAVLSFTAELEKSLRLELGILNFGGSLATPTVRPLSARELRLNRTFFRDIEAPDPAASLGIERYVSLLIERVTDHYQRRGQRRPRLFVEPGRAVTGDAQFLLASVLTVKRDGDRAFVVLDAGINLAESCRSEYHALLPVKCAQNDATEPYTVVGPICTPGDTLFWSARLPALAPGNAVVIMDAGAYFIPFSTSFSFPQPAIVMVDRGEVRRLRRAERFEDLVAYDQLGPLRATES